MWEWTEAVPFDTYRGVRGASFSGSYYGVHVPMQAATRSFDLPHDAYGNFGFRVAKVPGPVPEDLDHDGGVDLHDYALFQTTITGPR